MKTIETIDENVKSLSAMIEAYKSAKAEEKNAIANTIVDMLPEVMPSEEITGFGVSELVTMAHQNVVVRDRIINIMISMVEREAGSQCWRWRKRQ